MTEFGHTLEADRTRPLDTPQGLLRDISSQLAAAIDYTHFNKLEIARRKLANTAAICLAAMDWIDAELAERERNP